MNVVKILLALVVVGMVCTESIWGRSNTAGECTSTTEFSITVMPYGQFTIKNCKDINDAIDRVVKEFAEASRL